MLPIWTFSLSDCKLIAIQSFGFKNYISVSLRLLFYSFISPPNPDHNSQLWSFSNLASLLRWALKCVVSLRARVTAWLKYFLFFDGFYFKGWNNEPLQIFFDNVFLLYYLKYFYMQSVSEIKECRSTFTRFDGHSETFWMLYLSIPNNFWAKYENWQSLKSWSRTS